MATAEASLAPAPKAAPRAARAPKLGARIAYGQPAYNEVMDFLIQEAGLLDENFVEEWLALLSPDIFYTMPTRRTVARRDGSGFDPQLGSFFWDNFETLTLRVRRLTKTDSAFAEDPPSRTRRHVTNLTLFETDIEGEYAAHSHLLLLRNRHDQTSYDIVSALRKDIIRRTEGGCRLAQRTILIDQAALGTHNLAIFL